MDVYSTVRLISVHCTSFYIRHSVPGDFIQLEDGGRVEPEVKTLFSQYLDNSKHDNIQ